MALTAHGGDMLRVEFDLHPHFAGSTVAITSAGENDSAANSTVETCITLAVRPGVAHIESRLRAPECRPRRLLRLAEQ